MRSPSNHNFRRDVQRSFGAVRGTVDWLLWRPSPFTVMRQSCSLKIGTTDPRGACHRAQKSPATTLYSVDPCVDRTMMQSYASSAKLRGSGTQSSQLCAPVLARHRNAGRMDDVNLDIACPQPARQTKAVAPSFIGDDDTLDVAPSLAGFSAPTMQQLQQSVL